MILLEACNSKNRSRDLFLSFGACEYIPSQDCFIHDSMFSRRAFICACTCMSWVLLRWRFSFSWNSKQLLPVSDCVYCLCLSDCYCLCSGTCVRCGMFLNAHLCRTYTCILDNILYIMLYVIWKNRHRNHLNSCISSLRINTY